MADNTHGVNTAIPSSSQGVPFEKFRYISDRQVRQLLATFVKTRHRVIGRFIRVLAALPLTRPDNNAPQAEAILSDFEYDHVTLVAAITDNQAEKLFAFLCQTHFRVMDKFIRSAVIDYPQAEPITPQSVGTASVHSWPSPNDLTLDLTTKTGPFWITPPTGTSQQESPTEIRGSSLLAPIEIDSDSDYDPTLDTMTPTSHTSAKRKLASTDESKQPESSEVNPQAKKPRYRRTYSEEERLERERASNRASNKRRQQRMQASAGLQLAQAMGLPIPLDADGNPDRGPAKLCKTPQKLRDKRAGKALIEMEPIKPLAFDSLTTQDKDRPTVGLASTSTDYTLIGDVARLHHCQGVHDHSTCTGLYSSTPDIETVGSDIDHNRSNEPSLRQTLTERDPVPFVRPDNVPMLDYPRNLLSDKQYTTSEVTLVSFASRAFAKTAKLTLVGLYQANFAVAAPVNSVPRLCMCATCETAAKTVIGVVCVIYPGEDRCTNCAIAGVDKCIDAGRHSGANTLACKACTVEGLVCSGIHVKKVTELGQSPDFQPCNHCKKAKVPCRDYLSVADRTTTHAIFRAAPFAPSDLLAHSCMYCGFRGNARELADHMQIHIFGMPWGCDVCWTIRPDAKGKCKAAHKTALIAYNKLPRAPEFESFRLYEDDRCYSPPVIAAPSMAYHATLVSIRPDPVQVKHPLFDLNDSYLISIARDSASYSPEPLANEKDSRHAILDGYEGTPREVKPVVAISCCSLGSELLHVLVQHINKARVSGASKIALGMRGFDGSFSNPIDFIRLYQLTGGQDIDMIFYFCEAQAHLNIAVYSIWTKGGLFQKSNVDTAHALDHFLPLRLSDLAAAARESPTASSIATFFVKNLCVLNGSKSYARIAETERKSSSEWPQGLSLGYLRNTPTQRFSNSSMAQQKGDTYTKSVSNVFRNLFELRETYKSGSRVLPVYSHIFLVSRMRSYFLRQCLDQQACPCFKRQRCINPRLISLNSKDKLQIELDDAFYRAMSKADGVKVNLSSTTFIVEDFVDSEEGKTWR